MRDLPLHRVIIDKTICCVTAAVGHQAIVGMGQLTEQDMGISLFHFRIHNVKAVLLVAFFPKKDVGVLNQTFH